MYKYKVHNERIDICCFRLAFSSGSGEPEQQGRSLKWCAGMWECASKAMQTNLGPARITSLISTIQTIPFISRMFHAHTHRLKHPFV